MTREEARTSRRKVRRDSCFFVTKFNPRAPDIRKIFRKHRYVLNSDEQAKKILPEVAILVWYKRNANLKELLAPSNPISLINWKVKAAINVMPSAAIVVRTF